VKYSVSQTHFDLPVMCLKAIPAYCHCCLSVAALSSYCSFLSYPISFTYCTFSLCKTSIDCNW